MEDEELYVTIGDKMNTNTVDTLIRYNPETGNAEELYESEYPEAYMQKTQANEEWIVWVDASVDGLNSKLLAMNLSNQKVKELTKTDPDYPSILSQIYMKILWLGRNQEKSNKQK